MNQLEQILKDRQKLFDVVRSFFRTRDFLEVETPLLVASPDMEPTLSPFETQIQTPEGEIFFAGLITSPEYSMKKLLGLGAQKIFTCTKAFRNQESFGPLHNPEFTLLEWYKQGEDFEACMTETEDLVHAVYESFGKKMKKIERVSVDQLFQEHVGITLVGMNVEKLHAVCKEKEIHTDATDTESDLFYRLFLAYIEPSLKERTLFLHSYPTYQAALAKLTPDKNFGERFELYIDGLEICNGFTELTDPKEQRERFQKEQQTRQDQGKTVFPIDETLLSLLASIQNPTYGNALGLDRLLMCATNRAEIEDVLPLSVSKLFRS